MLSSSQKLFAAVPKTRALMAVTSVRHFNPPVHSLSADHDSDSSIFPVHKRDYYKSYFENGHAPKKQDDVKFEMAQDT